MWILVKKGSKSSLYHESSRYSEEIWYSELFSRFTILSIHCTDFNRILCISFQAVRGQQIFTIYTFILGFAIPLFLILIFYAQVVYKLRTVGPKSNSAHANGKSKSHRKKSHAKVTRLVLTVITVYIFCWFPYWITQLALIFAR